MSYTDLFFSATTKPEWVSTIKLVKNRILANKTKYDEVEQLTGCPWWFVAVIHQMEAGGKKDPFSGHLHNGDPLTGRTVNVPKGRPLGNPPFTWVESAVDALNFMAKNNATWVKIGAKWDLESALIKLEAYNGMGYKKRGINTPYLWSGTQHYTSGKYVLDGKFDSTAVSKQPGVVPILKALGV